MRILFGPEHDNCHINPDEPGAYEWWYFDALSQDGRYALVVIYFLGSPMTPYYKAVVDNKQPHPRDWCGVFVSLHERSGTRWKERAYAYNLYRGGDFSAAEPVVCVGDSRFSVRRSGDLWRWKVSVTEPGLWRGITRAELAFTAPCPPIKDRQMGDANPESEAAHTWACVAPVCRVEGHFLLPNGKNIAFTGDGYHDHNFGCLPYKETEIWYWGRALLRNHDGGSCTAVFYETHTSESGAQKNVFLFDAEGRLFAQDSTVSEESTKPVIRLPYGLRHQSEVTFEAPAAFSVPLGGKNVLVSGPFYRRTTAPFALFYQGETVTGEGIVEVFRPARLCGPIASRAMWSRIRRRS